jgi:hypothetical protein
VVVPTEVSEIRLEIFAMRSKIIELSTKLLRPLRDSYMHERRTDGGMVEGLSV